MLRVEGCWRNDDVRSALAAATNSFLACPPGTIAAVLGWWVVKRLTQPGAATDFGLSHVLELYEKALREALEVRHSERPCGWCKGRWVTEYACVRVRVCMACRRAHAGSCGRPCTVLPPSCPSPFQPCLTRRLSSARPPTPPRAAAPRPVQAAAAAPGRNADGGQWQWQGMMAAVLALSLSCPVLAPAAAPGRPWPWPWPQGSGAQQGRPGC